MRDLDLQPKRRRRFVATTDSNHDGLIFPDLACNTVADVFASPTCLSARRRAASSVPQ
jgi:hypothetical protein